MPDSQREASRENETVKGPLALVFDALDRFVFPASFSRLRAYETLSRKAGERKPGKRNGLGTAEGRQTRALALVILGDVSSISHWRNRSCSN